MTRPEPRTLTVTNSLRITPNMHRVTLGGDGYAGFPEGQDGGYVKLRLSELLNAKDCVRTYTIRHQSTAGIEIDFALHGSGDTSGPATNWAVHAQNGDTINVGGPGKAKPLPEGKGPFLLVGDMTALPAISVNLEALPDDAVAHAIILVRDARDKQEISAPEGVSVDWIVEPDLGTNPTLLANAARQISKVDELAYVWVACEFEAMKLLRQFFRVEHGLGKEQLYISSYWKRGMVEDDHKRIKRVDAEAVG